MLYVYDLTMRMQKIKSELIKYELARYKKEQSKPLDFMINELITEYIKLNKEFIIYNSLLRPAKFRQGMRQFHFYHWLDEN